MARGNATVSGEKGYIRIDARFDKLSPPSQFGREYLTYVLWAITPEGRATNLGEVQRDDDDARVKVTTELQAFGLDAHGRAVLRGDAAERRRGDGERRCATTPRAAPRPSRRSSSC